MKVSHEAFQATELSPAPGVAAAGPRRRRQREAPPEEPGEAGRVGVVFVHGIGSQKPAETFLDWSGAIVRMLAAWRAEQGFDVDPVVRAQFAFHPGALPFLELDVPAHAGRHAARWILTEALWAEAVRSPSLDVAAAYLRDRLATIAAGVRRGYGSRQPTWDERTGRLASAAAPYLDGWRRARLAEIDPPHWRWIGAVDWLQRSVLSQGLLVVPVVALGTALLALWAPLRRLPIGPLREFADAQLVDSFLTDWFGDLPVLLDDPVQAGNIRARTAEAIRALQGRDCDSIVVVAHSGGAIVSFETLLDPAYRDDPERAIRVDKLVTHGEGLNLGWRLEDAYGGGLERGHRLAGDVGAVRPDLYWVDVWASFDPAPAGPLAPPGGVGMAVAPPGQPGATARRSADGRIVVESRPVTNRMSLRGDHGAYWDNDEGFLVALLRHLDDPRGSGSDSRFYRDRDLRTVRIERRRQRVAVLAAWRWLVAVGALAAVIGGGLLAGAPRVAAETLIAVWERVPGGELLAAPVHAAWGALGALLAAAGLGDAAAALPDAGPVLIGAIVVAALFAALGAAGVSAWDRWDRGERALARLERLPPTDRRFAAATGVALLVGLLVLLGTAFSAGDAVRATAVVVVGLAAAAAASVAAWPLLPVASDAPEPDPDGAAHPAGRGEAD